MRSLQRIPRLVFYSFINGQSSVLFVDGVRPLVPAMSYRADVSCAMYGFSHVESIRSNQENYNGYSSEHRGQTGRLQEVLGSDVDPSNLNSVSKAGDPLIHEEVDLVDSIMSQSSAMTRAASSPDKPRSRMPMPVKSCHANGSKDVLGANLVRGFRSALKPLPFSAKEAEPAHAAGMSSDMLENLVVECEKRPHDNHAIDDIIDLDFLCATFTSGHEDFSPSDSSGCVSLLTDCCGCSSLDKMCHICGRAEAYQFDCFCDHSNKCSVDPT